VVIVQLFGVEHLRALVILVVLKQTSLGRIAAHTLHLRVLFFLRCIPAGVIGGGRVGLLVDGGLRGSSRSRRIGLRALRGDIIRYRADLLLLTFRRTAGFFQDLRQSRLDTGAVAAALRTDHTNFLIGMERSAGAEPAVLGILRYTGQQGVAGTLLQRFGNGRRKHARRLQAHTFIGAKIHTVAVQERAV